MVSSRITYYNSHQVVQKVLSTSIFLLFFFISTPSSFAQQLVSPEKFEPFLPDVIADSWNKSSFNSFSSQDENLGAASYMASDNAIMQIGIRHYSSDKWNQEKAKTKEDSTPEKVGKYTLYLGEMMGQREALLFLDNNFSIRITGPQNKIDQQLSTIINSVSPDNILALVPPQKSTTSSENETSSNSLKKLLPDNLAEMQHGKIMQQSSGSVVSTTYGNDNLPYSVNIQLAKGDIAQNYHKRLQDNLSEPNTDLQQVEHNNFNLFYREEESAISYMAFYNNHLIVVGADAPAQTTFDLEEARLHLLNAFDELISKLK